MREFEQADGLIQDLKANWKPGVDGCDTAVSAVVDSVIMTRCDALLDAVDMLNQQGFFEAAQELLKLTISEHNESVKRAGIPEAAVPT